MGLLSFDRAPVVRAQDLIIIIHPFWTDDGLYRDNVQRLAREHPQPILVLESQLVLDCQDTRINSYFAIYALEPCGPRYFLSTIMNTSEPCGGWKELHETVKMFGARTVRLAGCYLAGDSRSGYFQCVGSAFEELRKHISATLDLDHICLA